MTQDPFNKALMKFYHISKYCDVSAVEDFGAVFLSGVRPASKHLAISSGKGASLAQAALSALMESVEGYYLELPPTASHTGTYDELTQSHTVFHPQGAMRKGLGFLEAGKLPLQWLALEGVTTNEQALFPVNLLHLDTTTCAPNDWCFIKSSNGVAASFEQEYACLHSLLELLERRAHAAWQSLPKIELDLASIEYSSVRTWIARLQQSHKLRLWVIQNDYGLPVFHCSLIDDNPLRLPGCFNGTACALTVERALIGALLEACQSKISMHVGLRDDIYHALYQHMKKQNNPYHSADTLNALERVDFTAYASYQSLVEAIKHDTPELPLYRREHFEEATGIYFYQHLSLDISMKAERM